MWDWFKEKFQETIPESDQKILGGLHAKVISEFEDLDDQSALVVTCLAGLFARVAFRDLEIDPEEKNLMIASLEQWTQLDGQQSKAAVTLAIQNAKSLSGNDNHLYALPLDSLFSESQKIDLLKALFAIAASDGVVENEESEEIRLISNRLSLTHQHFIATRATVVEYLGALKAKNSLKY